MQSPFAHAPLHAALSPSHATWQGGASHVKSHFADARQVQLPFAHAAVQVEPAAQSAWQGGASHARSQLAPSGQAHTPSAQAGAPHEARAALSARRTRIAAQRIFTRR